MKRIAIYSRKSKETDTGESIKNQIKICKDYFEKNYDNCTFEIFEDEGFSGGNTNRPAFKRMMQLAEHRQFDIVAAYKIDRISRNTLDFLTMFEKLKIYDIELVSVTEGFDVNTPSGRMMMSMISSMAEMERANIAQRVKDNMFELAKLGRWSGGTPPTGYRSVRINVGSKTEVYLELIPEAKDVVKKIFTMIADGYTTYEVGKVMNLSAKTILNIVTNPTYMASDEEGETFLKSLGYKVYGQVNGKGFLSYNRRPKKNGKKLSNSSDMFVSISTHEAIVTSSEWIAAYSNIKSRKIEAKPRVSQLTFLSHLVKCKCGSGMFVSPGRYKKDGTRVLYFRCSDKKNNKNCDSSYLKVQDVENSLLDTLNSIALDKSLLNAYIKSQTPDNLENEINKLKKEISKNNDDISSLTEKLILINGSAVEIISNKINEIHSHTELLNSKLFELEREKLLLKSSSLDIDSLYKGIKDLLDNWNDLTILDKQVSIKKLIKSIDWDGSDGISINLK